MSIDVKNVSKTFIRASKRQKILDDVCLTTESAEVIGLAGINGAGKSTLIKIILGLLKQDSGQVTISNDFVAKDSCRRFGFLREGGYDLINELTILDNIEYFSALYNVPNNDRHQARHRLENYHLDHLANEGISKLSRGQKQSVSIICATLHNPMNVILDEPTIGLDERVLASLRNEILASKEGGVTTLIATHDFGFLRSVCDCIYVLHNAGIQKINNGQLLEKECVFELIVQAGTNIAFIEQFDRRKKKVNVVKAQNGMIELTFSDGDFYDVVKSITPQDIVSIKNLDRDPYLAYKRMIAL